MNNLKILNKTRIDEKTKCWIWVGAVTKQGYGRTKENGKLYLAHRLSYEVFRNRRIKQGYFICHKCDTPGCVNPEHLFEGTARDNFVDAVKKGRIKMLDGKNGRHYKKGYISEFRKLTNQQVKELRDYVALGNSIRSSARKFGIDYNSAWKIVRRINYAKVK